MSRLPGPAPLLPGLTVLAGSVALAAAPCASAPGSVAPPDSAYLAGLEAWHAGREARLRRPDGWLTLVGLFWLEAGENPVGSSEESRVVLPAGKAPDQVGVIEVRDGAVRFRATDDAAPTHAGEPVRELSLATDASGSPTVLELGSLSFHVIDRDGRLGVRVKDSESPLLAAFEGIDRYPVAHGWRLPARFEPHDPPKPVTVPDFTGHAGEVEVPGALVFEIDGTTYRLDVLDASDDGYFVVFGDETNGRETYGGGRFLFVETGPAADSLASGAATSDVILDFNRAYNPPCVFTPYATCPLPTAENQLPIAITAGELMYGEGHH